MMPVVWIEESFVTMLRLAEGSLSEKEFEDWIRANSKPIGLTAIQLPVCLHVNAVPFKKAIGVTSVHTEEDYARATAMIDVLLDEIGDDENHPLADVLDYLADQVKASLPLS